MDHLISFEVHPSLHPPYSVLRFVMIFRSLAVVRLTSLQSKPDPLSQLHAFDISAVRMGKQYHNVWDVVIESCCLQDCLSIEGNPQTTIVKMEELDPTKPRDVDIAIHGVIKAKRIALDRFIADAVEVIREGKRDITLCYRNIASQHGLLSRFEAVHFAIDFEVDFI